MVLIDTDVLVECLRGSTAANNWLRSLSKEPFAIPGIAAMELIVGCRNQAELQQIRKFLGAFAVAWPDAAESAQAYELLTTHRLASGISISRLSHRRDGSCAANPALHS